MAEDNIVELNSSTNNKLEEGENINTLFDSLLQILPNFDDIEETFGALFGLDDEDFKVLSPIFLNEIEKTYNDPGASLLLASMLNSDGIKYEDLIESYNLIIKNIDDEEDDISLCKKDFIKRMLVIILNAVSETQALTKRIIDIPFMKLNENAKMPTYAHVGDAAADLYALESYDIGPGEQAMIKTGIACAIPLGYAMLIQPRSGISAKSKLRICNTPGLIDSGYRGEICVIMENVDAKIKDLVIDNDGKATGILYGSSYHIEAGDRIAQARLVEVPTMAFEEVEELEDTDRGEGGFGSTGE